MRLVSIKKCELDLVEKFWTTMKKLNARSFTQKPLFGLLDIVVLFFGYTRFGVGMGVSRKV